MMRRQRMRSISAAAAATSPIGSPDTPARDRDRPLGRDAGGGARTAAEKGLANIETQQAPAENLPFADATFDFLGCRYSAHHWRDFVAGLREARRVLTKGATAVFIDAYAPGVRSSTRICRRSSFFATPRTCATIRWPNGRRRWKAPASRCARDAPGSCAWTIRSGSRACARPTITRAPSARCSRRPRPRCAPTSPSRRTARSCSTS